MSSARNPQGGAEAAPPSDACRVVAVVEDNDGLRLSVGRLLRAGGYDTALFESAEAYLAAPPKSAHCLLLDIHLPGMSGLDLQRHLRAQPNARPIILTTADRSLAEHAERQRIASVHDQAGDERNAILDPRIDHRDMCDSGDRRCPPVPWP